MALHCFLLCAAVCVSVTYARWRVLCDTCLKEDNKAMNMNVIYIIMKEITKSVIIYFFYSKGENERERKQIV